MGMWSASLRCSRASPVYEIERVTQIPFGGKMRIGYLGPIGTFSEEAAVQYTKHKHIKDPMFIPFPDLLAVGDAVLEQQIDIGILPVENALDGQVNSVNDMLISTAKLCGCGEVVLPVRIHLVGKKDITPEKCTRIYSHPQPFGQCVQ